MLRNVIGSENVTEIYKVATEVKRGAVVEKDASLKVANKADGEGVEIWLVDADNQPTGHLSDVEISQYDPSLDTVQANSLAVLKKYPVGAQIATDQVSGDFVAGEYAIAGTGASAGLLVPAVATNVSTLKFIGDFVDGDKVLKQFEVVLPHTVA